MKKYRSLELFNVDKDSVTSESQKPYGPSWKMSLIVIFDLGCVNSHKILKNASDLAFFNKNTKWFLFSLNYNSTLTILKQLEINIDARMLLFIRKNPVYSIFHIRCPALRRNGVIYVNPIGNYSTLKGINLKDPFLNINYTMDGIFMNVAMSVSFNFFHFCY